MEIKYKMWNRVVNKGDEIEICLYDENWNRVEKKIILMSEWDNLQYTSVSPIEVYYKTNGTMGI